MNKTDASALLDWYAVHKRELPWRQTRDAYSVLVSELMLQQTTVVAVVPLYRRWMARFPTLQSLAAASLDEVTEAWSGLGYYSRARRLREAALLLSRDGYPDSLAGWRALPGLGPYTAAAVSSIALGLPHLALDTNALRVLLRYYGQAVRPDNAAAQADLRDRVEAAYAGCDFGIVNQAIMELGATICKPREPGCLLCPISPGCRARREGRQSEIPLAKPNKPPKETAVNAYLLSDAAGGLILVRGTSVGLLSDLYQPFLDFGPENASASPLTALLEWLREQDSSPAGVVRYGISGRRLTVTLKRFSPAGEAEALPRCLALETRSYRLEGTNQGIALSSLTRKILKAWRESLAALRAPDGRC